MKKVLIVGISGTGKTRLAKILGSKLSLPVIHLDSIFWKENWEEKDENVIKDKIAKELQKDSWIIEGYIEPLSKHRIAAADTIIYLDYPGYIALIGAVKRMVKHRKTPRPEMPAGNTDKFGYEFLKSIYKRDERPEIEAAINNSNKVIRLTSRRAANKFLSNL